MAKGSKSMTDIYQERYKKHQLHKKEVLIRIMKKRYTERAFSDEQVKRSIIDELIESVGYCPSSCNRKAVYLRVIEDKDLKNLLGGILVGGVGWVHRAPVLLMIMASRQAYKSKDEISFMPFLDAGIVIQQLYLMGTSLGLKTAYVNPNIREMNISHFEKIFGKDIFCGVFAVGYKL